MKMSGVLLLLISSNVLFMVGQDNQSVPQGTPAPVASTGSTGEPEPYPEQKKPAPPAQPINYGPGIDTLNIESSGNWLQKRMIWEDAQKKYDMIKNINHQITEARLAFFDKRSTSDRDLNIFYNEIGFAQGELEQVITDLFAAIEQERKTQGDLTEQERSFHAKLQAKKQELEQLKSDMKSITDFDAAINTAMQTLVQQVTLSNNHERQAWERFKAIGQELDDRKAREHYAHMQASEKNLEAILAYIKGPLAEYFNVVMTKINEFTVSVKSRIQEFKNSGIELKKQLSAMEDEEAKAAERARSQREAEIKKKAPMRTWYDTISTLWRYPLSWAQSLWNTISSWIFTKSVPQRAVPQQVAPQGQAVSGEQQSPPVSVPVSAPSEEKQS